MFIVTLTLVAWALKSLTIFLITSPSPPVKPFQKASSTAGPVYSAPPEPVSGLPAWPAGELPPPQAARARPALVAPVSAMNERRLKALEDVVVI